MITSLFLDSTDADNQPSVPIGASTSNLNFSGSNLPMLQEEVESKLGCKLNTPNGLVKLLLTQQMLLAKQSTLLKSLRDEVAQLNKKMHWNEYQGDEDSDDPTIRADSFQEYINLAEKTKNKEFRNDLVSEKYP